MPRRDGTGPQGNGPIGRGGNCQNNNSCRKGQGMGKKNGNSGRGNCQG